MSNQISRARRHRHLVILHWSLVISTLVIGHFPLVISAAWLPAEPGYSYEFPRDHRPHPGFKTEWWYFTGNVRDDAGRRFGYQVTFFRQGLRRPSGQAGGQSRFIVDDLKFAHFTVTDVASGRFHFQQRLSRGAFGEAGFLPVAASPVSPLAWIDDWTLTRPELSAVPGSPVPASSPGGFTLAARTAEAAIAFTLADGKPWTIHGTRGISQKADGPGHASHYYSGTRMPTRGQLTVGGRTHEVRGESWFDHEWATNQLTAEQVGWDWFSLQFDDGTELMLYALRLRDGTLDPNSSATFTAADGTTRHLTRDQLTLRPISWWKSKATGGQYPIAWELSIPSLDLTARVTTPVENQELVLLPIAYWEGLIDVRGTRAGQPIAGHGYLELTGYAGALVGLSAGSP
jgi:predicted secreted hydrolase